MHPTLIQTRSYLLIISIYSHVKVERMGIEGVGEKAKIKGKKSLV